MWQDIRLQAPIVYMEHTMTQEKNEIKISQKLCERIEDGFRDGWLIDLPDDSKHAGYQMYVSNYYVDLPTERSRYLCLSKGQDDFLYTLYKKVREPGKRYPRYKLTFDELADVFSEHSAQFGVPAYLPYVLAYCKDYANDATRNAGRVLGYYYCIGQADETWLYLDDVVRRRLGTHGVKIIKQLTSEEVASMKQMLKRRAEIRSHKNWIEECYIKIPECKLKRQKEYLSEYTVSEVQKRLKEIDALIDADFAAEEQELAQIENYLATLGEAN